MEKIKNNLTLEIYNKGGSVWYCDYYFYNGINFKKGTTRAGGYGYDKHSTATSEAINKFKFLYRLKSKLNWIDISHVTTSKGDSIYGLYKDKSISYGIGISSVLHCLEAFSNIKIKFINYGNRSDVIHLEIITTEKQLQKEIERNKKILSNKKSNKTDKKEAKETIKQIQELFKMEV
jgi:hypothetical protein